MTTAAAALREPAASPTAADEERLDRALEALADRGPELRNGFTSHAPMVVEALVAGGRADAVGPWLAAQAADLQPWPAAQRPIAGDAWRAALGRPERVADWRDHFARELAEAPWQAVLARWVARLAPAVCADATHGVIRVGHAVRALGRRESAARLRELGDGLALWAATAQRLPTAAQAGGERLPAREALARVPRVPEAQRTHASIVAAFAGLDAFPAFAPVIDGVDLSGDPEARISELTAAFAALFLANARDRLGVIVFTHGVTALAALRPLLPHLPEPTAREALRHAWQAGCALQACFGTRGPAADPPAPAPLAGAAVFDGAVANGDDHAIKLAQACWAEDALDPRGGRLAAAARAQELLAAG